MEMINLITPVLHYSITPIPHFLQEVL